MSSLAVFVAVALLVPMAVAECGEVSPWLAKRLLGWAARRLRSPEKTTRYTEEWLADLELVPGKITKLGWAIGIACTATIQLREPKSSLDWTQPTTALPFATDSVFGPGNPAARPQPVPARTAHALPAPPRIAAPAPERTLQDCNVPIGIGSMREHRIQTYEPPPPAGLRAGERFFHGYYNRWGAREHHRRYLVDDEHLFAVDQKAAPPVIGL